MADRMLANATAISEFVTDPQYGWLNGTCGETALAIALGCVRHQAATPNDIITIYRDMRARNLAAANGASTIEALTTEAKTQGATIDLEVPYAEPFGYDWRSLLRAVAGHLPVVVEYANAQYLHDVVTGSADEPGVHYHFNCIVGMVEGSDTTDPIYLVADGDNAHAGQIQHYTEQTLAYAVPCAILVLQMEDAMPTLPNGYTQVDPSTVRYDATGVTIHGEVLKLWLQAPAIFGAPRGAEVATSDTTTEQRFYSVIFGAARAADGSWSGLVGDAPHQLDMARGAVVQAQRQIDTLTAQLKAATQPTLFDPAQVAAFAAAVSGPIADAVAKQLAQPTLAHAA